MKRDRMAQLRSFWKEFRQVRFGVVGLVLFVVFLIGVVFEGPLLTYRDTNTRWRDMLYWTNSPRYAMPVWVNWFTSKDYAKSAVIEPHNVVEQTDGLRSVTMDFPYEYQAGRPPSDVLVDLAITGQVALSITVERPDGRTLTYTKQTSSSGSQQLRISVDQNLRERVYQMVASAEDPAIASARNPKQINAVGALFGKAQHGIFSEPEVLNGTYKTTLQVTLVGATAKLDRAQVVIAGGVSGILGTDGNKRDLWSGLVAGTKWALIIGLLTSLISVAVGVVYGVTSGYFGGWVDSLMNRIYEIFVSIPLLPILIVLSAVFKPSIWIMIIMMCVFFWVGPVKTVRSIALQLKENAYIEAAHGLGATHRRILFKHMIPQLVPYAFASMALAVPGAITYEASISLIGLGDATVVTWGQILFDAFSSGAVLQGIWWWIVPPGLAIALMGMTFAFIGFAMDTILNPKLRTR
ncbi:MAG: ABC transporter permease [Candidatus Bipolaricaulis sp.]|nr:ABC transporter permease [Candidatus Bipolaricaulis sp.]MDD5219640.1 ABC transporter permease [Candidatus Bipolaricaulis sp.]MDD5645740.1 ABC transporter permease [Candidatus Bipolaricaulis sp.]